jgi:F-type H+-transporting ATPase subunit delta
MSDASTTARPYARAVFELAREDGSLDAWSAALASLAAVGEVAEVRALIARPGIPRETLAGIVADAARIEGARERNLVRLLAENGRLSVLASLAEQYEAVKRDFEQTMDVEITTAVPAGDSEKAALVRAVEQKLSRRINVDWAVDESLIAGARIRAGDTVIDGSAAAELDQLRQALNA